jgi:hypothetical protein
MIFEQKEGSSLSAVDKKKTVYYGVLTVNDTGEIKIPVRGRPLEVQVGFSDPTPPPSSCGPVTPDVVDIEIDHLHSPFPLWAIKISWDINSGGIREIAWRATVVK